MKKNNAPAPIAAPHNIQTVAARPEPVMTLVDDGSRTYLDVHMFDYLGYVYALLLRGNPRRNVELFPVTEIYSFATMIERDRFYGALKQLMAYQHADALTASMVKAYDKEIAEFRGRMAEMEKSR